MKSKIIGLALFVMTVAGIVFYPTVAGHGVVVVDLPAPIVTFGQPLGQRKIEAVFVLDTTGSMSGLLDAAKEKIFSIASTMASAQSAPEIHMGLVAFRDRGDTYVTKVVDLSQDLDSMYAALIDLEAGGGGDTPESVNAALYEAVHTISWSQDPNSYRVVFLIGDAPPHMDYPDEVKYPEILAMANAKGIVVNTIRCGNSPVTEQQWRQIAAATQGSYFSVDQAGGAIAIDTPFDEKIATLSSQLDDTRIFFGSVEDKARAMLKIKASEKLHASASPASRARRAAFNATASGEANLYGENELIEEIASGRIELDDIAAADLPEPMQAMSPSERSAMVEATNAKRDALERRIKGLADKRENYLAEQVAKVEGADTSLDYQIYDTLKSQAIKKGIEYEAAAPKL
ncbi:MAG: VWA domain-containing protein [Gammaproteobacteria bacterium]|nr:VWA domain-containing protein [Gammaproteobacteria bacterium]